MNLGAWQLELTRPLWLAALIVLPALVYYWRRTLVHFPARQRAASLAVRSLLVILVVLALCGPQLRGAGDRVQVVAVVDHSMSVSPSAVNAAEAEYWQEAERQTDRADFKTHWFARESGDLPAPNSGVVLDFAPDRRATDIARAIALARASIPANRVGHIVLFSDGHPTIGDTLASAKAAGVPVSTVPLASCEPEVYVARVTGPDRVRQGQPFQVEVVVQATLEDDATVQLLRGSEVALKEQKHLVKGENRFTFNQKAPEGPAVALLGRIEGCKDTIAENNCAGCVVQVSPKPRVLVVESQPTLAKHLKTALVNENIEVEVSSPQEKLTPGQTSPLARLADYDLLVLSNIPATSLSPERMKAVQSYVRDGGGLIAVGGDQAFTAGGYRSTPLEDALPVISEAKREKPKPTLAMVLVTDVSLSMKEGQRIELAKAAMRRAVEVLDPRDQVGILAFEDRSRWVVPLRPATEKQPILDRIAALEARGETNMHPAIEQAYLALRDAYADLKHMIVLTDGISAPGDFESLTKQIAAAGITVSTVGVGQEPARPLLEGIAAKAKGHSYFVDDAAALPKIFAMETASAGRIGITEKPIVPRVMRSAPALAGLDFAKAPALLGYVETQARPESQVVLNSEYNEPILAWWKYGKGTSVAFTSDIQEKSWAGTWLLIAPDLFNQFWVQLVRQAMRREPPPSCVLRAEVASNVVGTLRVPDRVRHTDHANMVPGADYMDIILDAADSAGRFINAARPLVTVSGPGGKPQEVSLEQIVPGRYAANLALPASTATPALSEYSPPTPATYHLTAKLTHNGHPIAVPPFGLVVSYPEELRIRPTNTDLLRAIAEASGGQYQPQPADVFSPGDRTVPLTLALWPGLLLAAIIIFLVDLTLKRIEWRRS